MVRKCFDVVLGVLVCVYLSSLAASAQAGAVQYGKQVVLGVPVDVVRVDLNSRNILVTPELPLSFPHFSPEFHPDKKNAGSVSYQPLSPDEQGMDTGQNETVTDVDAYKAESLPAQSPPKVGYRKIRQKYPAEGFSSMIRRLNPIAAINGTYFDTVTKRPVGTIVINGQLVHVGDRGTAMCLDSNNRVEFLLTSGIPGTAIDWTRYRAVISTGPTLVRNDRIYLYPRAEKFKDPAVYARARRSAVGVTREQKLLLVTVKRKITLRQLARIMKALGAADAVALDGGTSSGLYFRGKMITKPGRTLTNILSVYETPSPALSPDTNRVPE